MIGGSGEKKTLRMAAQYADESNLAGCPVAEIPRKLDVLEAHCARHGRERADIPVTSNVPCVIAPTTEEADAELNATAAVKGWSDEIVEMAKLVLVHGDPDTVGERLSEYMAAGLDGLTLSLPANGHVPGRVALLGETAGKLVN